MNSSAPHEITFRPVEEQDFPILAAWLVEPHVRRFYQKTPVTLEEIAQEYGPSVRGEEPSICHLARIAGTPFAYLQCYRNADYPEWMDMIGVDGGISVDLYIGESTYLRKGLGRASLSLYLQQVAFPYYSGETRAYIAHEQRNRAALCCSRAVGFRPLRAFLEDGCEMLLLATDRNSLLQQRPLVGLDVNEINML
jgi:aminoglycoside 6'-N-acetyltransferase